MKKKKRVSIAIKLLVVLFALYASVTIVDLYNKNIQQRNRNKLDGEALEDLNVEIDKLEDTTVGEPDEELIESIAREQLGYGKPGEQVYVDTSSK